MSEAQPNRYKLDHGQGVKEQIEAIERVSQASGKHDQFVEIMRESLRRLETAPHEWGDPQYRSKTVDAIAYRGIIRPIVFRYVVYEQVHAIVLLSVQQYADF